MEMKEPAVGQRCELTDLQKQMWHGHLLFADTPAYTLSVCFQLRGIDPDRFRRAFETMVQADPYFTVRLVGSADHAYLETRQPGDLPFTYCDLRAKKNESIEATRARRANLVLDPTGQIFDSLLVRVDETRYCWFISIHHIVADGWSVKIIVDRVARLYASDGGGTYGTRAIRPARGALRRACDLFDYSSQLIRYRDSPQFLEDERYWRSKLAPSYRPMGSYRAGPELVSGVIRTNVSLGPERARRILSATAREEGPSLNIARFNRFAAVLLTLLYKLSGESYLSLGVPFLNRGSDDQRNALGLFTQIGIFRLEIDRDETFESLLAKIAEEGRQTARHIRYPLNNINNRLYDVMLNVHNVQYEAIGDCTPQEEWLHSGNDTVPFTLHVRIQTPASVELQFDLQTGLFSAAERTNLIRRFLTVFDQALAQPEIALSQIHLTKPLQSGPSAPGRVARGHASTELRPLAHSGRGDLLHEGFERQAHRLPEAPAVFSGPHQISFGELDARSRAVSARLRELGHTPGIIVGVCMERSVGAVVGLLGILKAGGIWLPLDPAYPDEMLSLMLEDSDTRFVICDVAGRSRLESQQASAEQISNSNPMLGTSVSFVDIDRSSGRLLSSRRAGGLDGRTATPPSRPAQHAAKVTPAYCLYTSGSTGVPKAVIGSHEAALNRLAWMWRVFPFEREEVLLHKTSLSFIDSVWEIFGALLAGRALLIASPAEVQDPRRLAALVTRYPVRRIVLVPTLLRMLLNASDGFPASLTSISRWFVTGELFSSELARRLLHNHPTAEIFNLYGTTETYDAACHRVEVRDLQRDYIPIGRGIDNMQLQVLDAKLTPLPAGKRGELYVGGVGVAPGYLNRPNLTTEKFVPQDADAGVEQSPPSLLFRTGDAARLLPDGSIECIGRLDNQVKVRGYRVELEEIEYRLLRLRGVEEALAAVEESVFDGTRLVAYVKAQPGEELRPLEMRSELQLHLPPWMIPVISVVESFPLTPGGKKSRLSLLPQSREKSQRHAARAIPPGVSIARPTTNEAEARLAQIWKEVLDVAQVGIHDDFFDLGGNSLLALRTVAEIERRLGVRLPSSALFDSPTVHGLASRYLESGEPKVHRSPLVVHRPKESERLALFSVPPAGSTIAAFGVLARYLPEDQPLFSFQPRGVERGESPHASIVEMARDYVNEMKTIQPHGPYLLSGRCFGGYVAFEMAQQLLSAGESVAALVIIDSPEAPLGAGEQPSHVGVRKLLRYYPQRFRYFLKRRRLLYTVRMKLKNSFRYTCDRLLESLPTARLNSRERRLRILRSLHTLAYHRYVARPYPGKITILRADRPPDLTNERAKWERLASGGIEWHTIPGRHNTLMKEPQIGKVAAMLSECLKGIHEAIKDAASP